jgi:hypothetical protein
MNCQYCGNRFIENSRGGCSACGGNLPEETTRTYDHGILGYAYGIPVTDPGDAEVFRLSLKFKVLPPEELIDKYCKLAEQRSRW